MRMIFVSLTVGLVITILPLATVSAAGDGGTGASGGGSGRAPGGDTNLIAGQRALDAGDWRGAAEKFTQAINTGSDTADAYNLLAYSYRRFGQLDLAFDNYARALELNPRHRGAHEYIGEAYLLVGNPAKATQHLNALKDICGNCNETMKLRKAMARYKQNTQTSMLIPDDEEW